MRPFSKLLWSRVFVKQLFVVDLADIGVILMIDIETRGRERLNDSVAQLSGVIKQGLTGTVHNFRFDVTSLRQRASGEGINDGCTNGTVVATAANSADFTDKIAPPPVQYALAISLWWLLRVSTGTIAVEIQCTP